MAPRRRPRGVVLLLIVAMIAGACTGDGGLSATTTTEPTTTELRPPDVSPDPEPDPDPEPSQGERKSSTTTGLRLVDDPPEPRQLAIGDAVVEITTDHDLVDAFVHYRFSLWNPDAGVWGSVTVHNAERELRGTEPFGVVSGRDALTVERDVEAFDRRASVVVIPVDPWWIDVELDASGPVNQPRRLQEFLDGLTIDDAGDGLPTISDGVGWLQPFGGLTVVEEPFGFTLELSPNCEPNGFTPCLRDIGHLLPPTEIDDVVGADPRGGNHLRIPDDLRLEVIDYGTAGDLVTCDGFPAFDPLLLSSSLSLDEARSAIEVFTGVTDWVVRQQPGIQTLVHGEPDDPHTVSTIRRTSTGRWTIDSVLTCQ